MFAVSDYLTFSSLLSHYICHSIRIETAQEIVEGLQVALNGQHDRPKRLLVFINPFGGKQEAPKIFSTKVSPIFALAGITHQVVETEYRGHAAEIVMKEDLEIWDGLVAVGGDGFFGEVMRTPLSIYKKKKTIVNHPRTTGPERISY